MSQLGNDEHHAAPYESFRRGLGRWHVSSGIIGLILAIFAHIIFGSASLAGNELLYFVFAQLFPLLTLFGILGLGSPLAFAFFISLIASGFGLIFRQPWAEAMTLILCVVVAVGGFGFSIVVVPAPGILLAAAYCTVIGVMLFQRRSTYSSHASTTLSAKRDH